MHFSHRGHVLAFLRAAERIKGTELAKHLGCSRSLIAMVEAGIRPGSNEFWDRVYHYYFPEYPVRVKSNIFDEFLTIDTASTPRKFAANIFLAVIDQ